MKKNIAYKFRLYPTNNQQMILSKTFGCCRFIYNKMLEDKINNYKKFGTKLKNTPAMYKKKYEFLKEVDSLALSNTQQNLEYAYNSFFRKKNKYPKFKSRKNKQAYTTNNQNGTIRINNGSIKLPKIGYIKVKQHRIIPDEYILKSATVSKTKSGKYYVSILFEYENQVQGEVIPHSFIGLDYSMHELYVDSNGNAAKYPRFYRKSLEKLRFEQRRLSRMSKGSNNFYKHVKRIANIYEHITNQRKDFLHKLSRNIVDTYDVVCIEDLNMQSMSQSLNFGISVNDNGWGMFIRMLEYKLENSEKKLIKIDKFFPSSQICNCCGYQNKQTKNLSVREWICPKCNKYHNRDMNAAINIKNEGKRLMCNS